MQIRRQTTSDIIETEEVFDTAPQNILKLMEPCTQISNSHTCAHDGVGLDHAMWEAQVRARLRDNDPGAYLKAYKVFASAIDLAGPLAVKCPTLVIIGEGDRGSTLAMAQALGAAIDGVGVETLPGLRHMVPVEGAARVNDLLAAFVPSADGGGV